MRVGVVLLVLWVVVMLYGEASNPGPALTGNLDIATCNPTTIWDKSADLATILPAVIGVSETAATQAVQAGMDRAFRELNLNCTWSASVQPYQNAKSSLRGVAGGSAILSPYPCRPVLEGLPADIVGSSRICETHTMFAPHRFLQVISIYGPTMQFRYADPGTLMNRLFTHAAQRAMRFRGPSVIVGDFNVSTDKLDAWPTLVSQGWADCALISSLKNGHESRT